MSPRPERWLIFKVFLFPMKVKGLHGENLRPFSLLFEGFSTVFSLSCPQSKDFVKNEPKMLPSFCTYLFLHVLLQLVINFVKIQAISAVSIVKYIAIY